MENKAESNKSARDGKPAPTWHAVNEALREVLDPEFDVDIVDLGLVYRIDVTGARVEVDFTATYPGCPAIDDIQAAIEDKLHQKFVLDSLQVQVVWSPRWEWFMCSDEAKVALGYPV